MFTCTCFLIHNIVKRIIRTVWKYNTGKRSWIIPYNVTELCAHKARKQIREGKIKFCCAKFAGVFFHIGNYCLPQHHSFFFLRFILNYARQQALKILITFVPFLEIVYSFKIKAILRAERLVP